jgi:hypothetical protein
LATRRREPLAEQDGEPVAEPVRIGHDGS